MSETDHKLDHVLKVKTEDLVDQVHDKDVDLQSNHIYLFGREEYHNEEQSEPGVEYMMANRFIRNLNLCMRVNANTPIVIHMKTDGGYFEEGMAIYDAIKSCPFPVTILNYTHAASMSSIIFQAANKRVMMPHSTFMFHDGNLTLTGTTKQVFSSIDFTKIQEAQVMKIYVDNLKMKGKLSKRSRKYIQEWIRDQLNQKEDVYMTSEQAVEYGFADEVFDYNWANLTDYTDQELNRG